MDRLTPTTTLEELLLAGCTVTTPQNFEMRGDLAAGALSMRMQTPVGMTAAGHYPLTRWGVHLAACDANSYAEAVAREETASA